MNIRTTVDKPALPLCVRQLGKQPYQPVWQAMRRFTDTRGPQTRDEFWLVEHPPVYTQGQAGKAEHLLNPDPQIPIIKVDRGGQVTYHGPGQLVVYLLLDIKRRHLGVRALVSHMEQAIINVLASYDLVATGERKAPGVYVEGRKIAALGLRVRNGRTYHGLSLNVDMDLTPFSRINPCGYAGLEVTQTTELGIPSTPTQLSAQLLTALWHELGYNAPTETSKDLPQ